MTPEHRKIDRLEAQVLNLKALIEKLEEKIDILKEENVSLIDSLRADDSTDYIIYLQQSLKRMEWLHEDQQSTIEAYSNHYNRFRHYYEQGSKKQLSDHDILSV